MNTTPEHIVKESKSAYREDACIPVFITLLGAAKAWVPLHPPTSKCAYAQWNFIRFKEQ